MPVVTPRGLLGDHPTERALIGGAIILGSTIVPVLYASRGP